MGKDFYVSFILILQFLVAVFLTQDVQYDYLHFF